MDKKRVGLVALGALVVLALVGGIVFFGPWGSAEDGSGPGRPEVDRGDPATEVAAAFAAAWEDGTLADIAYTSDSGDVAGTTALTTDGLTVANGERPAVEVTEVTPAQGRDDRVVATASVTWKLDGDRTWTYDTSFALVRQRGKWLVAWAPSVVQPSLNAGEVLRVSRVAAKRGKIVDSAGKALVAQEGPVVVGIRRSRTPDPAGTARTVAMLTGVDADDLVADVLAADPEEFVEVATLPRADYDKIRDQVQPLPGTVFREEEADSGLPANYARAVLGTTGSATPEIAAASDGRIVAGEVTGLTGLQGSQDDVLAGSPGVSVQAVPPTEGAIPRAVKCSRRWTARRSRSRSTSGSRRSPTPPWPTPRPRRPSWPSGSAPATCWRWRTARPTSRRTTGR